jgi:hypothetical protein
MWHMSIRNRRVRCVIVLPVIPLSSLNSSVETSSWHQPGTFERVQVKNSQCTGPIFEISYP